jgi:predicted dehydrogenase
MEPTLSEALALIGEAQQALRESVVQAVMRRNRLDDDVKRLQLIVTDLEQKAALADRINNASLAAEIRSEVQQRQAELQRARDLFAQAVSDADTAKARMPEEEQRLTQRGAELRARFAQNAATQTGSSPAVANPDSLWARAGAKIDALRQEASARDEVSGVGRPTSAQLPPVSATRDEIDRSAEAMLAELEKRLGGAPAQITAKTEPGGTGRAHFLELDAPTTLVAPALPSAPAAVLTPVVSAVDVQEQQNKPEKAALPAATMVGRQTRTRIKGESSFMEPTQRVRVAAIGTGGINRGAHMPCYPEIAQMQLVAICDPDKNAQDLAIKRYQGLVEARIKRAADAGDTATVERLERDLETVQICDDISEVIEIVKPDLVDICTQPLLHTPLSIQALEAGINVMCEKPISRSWLESQRLIEVIKRTGKFYQHNENWLFDADYYTVKKLVDSGAIGELIAMFLTQAHGGPEGNPKFWDSNYGGGGSLLDNGIHAIGAAWYIAGLHKRPTIVKAAEPFGMSIRMPDRIIDGRYQKVMVDDDAHILIRFEDEKTHAWTTAHVEGSWSEQDSPDTVYIGTTGRIEMHNDEDGKRYAVITDAHGSSKRRFRVSGSNWQFWPSSFYGEILNMVECIRNNEQSIMTAEFGADCSAIVGAAYLSEKDGKRAVTLDEFRQFARDIAARYPDDPKSADDALVDALLSAVRREG